LGKASNRKREQREGLARRQAEIQAQVKAVASTTRQELFSIQHQRFSGPLPPPEMLVQYNEAFPGCAERIVKMAEEQSAHRRTQEAKVIDANVKREGRGSWFALIIALAGMGIAGFLIHEDKDLLGFSALIVDLAVLASLFFGARWRNERERRKKWEQATQAGANLPAPREEGG
jgi:uncharacterized membrane protein